MAPLTTETPVTRCVSQRMLDDMALGTMWARAQHEYVRHGRGFPAFLRRSPETPMAEAVRRFQLYQREDGVGESAINASVSALRFLFGVPLKPQDLSRKLVLAHCHKKLPDVLSIDEVRRLLEAALGIKYGTVLDVAQGAGLWRWLCLRIIR